MRQKAHVCSEAMEKGMAAHSSVLAWRIPRTDEAGGLQSVGSQRVGRDWGTKHSSEAKKGKVFFIHSEEKR